MSPDLNPIEHVLDMLYRRVHAVEPRGQNCIYIEQNKNKSSNKKKIKLQLLFLPEYL
jgi:transposase